MAQKMEFIFHLILSKSKPRDPFIENVYAD